MVWGHRRLHRTICSAFVVAAVAAGAAAPGQAARGDDPGTGHGKPQAAKNATLHGNQTVQGVVQSVSPRSIVLRLLDGSGVTIPVDVNTHVVVDGRPAALADVKPGFVAAATVKDGKPTPELQAFDPSIAGTGIAVVQTISPSGVVVTTAGGSAATIRVTPRTRIFVDGKPASLRDLKAGFTIVLAGAKSGKPAAELHFLRPS